MNELHFAYKVRQHLNRGLRELRPETTKRLATARQRAVANHKQSVRLSVLASVGGFAQHYFDGLRIKQVLTAFILLLCLVFTAYWIADQRVTELGAIDSALLSDDLPINAFTDKGFDAWLKRGSPQ